MATIPQSIDLGPRPSLRTSRVDIPGSGELAPADAIVNAASTFASVMADRKQKQDAFSYSMATTDLRLAAITTRDSFDEDQDYETFDQRYREQMGKARDAASARIRNDHDRAIFDAESALILEQGASDIGELARSREHDFKRGELVTMGERLSEAISLEPAAVSIELMLQYQDLIASAVADGVLGAAEGAAMSISTTQETAVARLESMSAEDRAAEIRRSLEHRKSGGAITPEDIRAGSGTGSIADFVHTDIATQMLERAEAENKTTNDRIAAFAVVDEAAAMFPLVSQEAERNKYIRDHTEGDIRAMASDEMRLRNNEKSEEQRVAQNELADRYSLAIENDGMSFNEIPPRDLELMSPDQRNALRAFSQSMIEGEGFGDHDDSDMFWTWRQLPPSAKAEQQLNTAAWRMAFTRDTWNQMLGEQQAIQEGLASARAKPPDLYAGDGADEVLNGLLVGVNGLYPRVPEQGSDEYARYDRIAAEANLALVEYSRKQYAETGSGALTPTQIAEVTAEMLREEVFIRKYGADTRTVRIGVSADEGDDAYIPYEKAQEDMSAYDGLGNQISAAQWLNNQANAFGVVLSKKALEEAYYYYRYQGEEAAINRIRNVPGY